MEERLKQQLPMRKEFSTFVSEWGGQNQIVYEADNLWEWISKNFVPLDAGVIRRKRDIVIGSWSATKKYKCPECSKVMIRQGSLYFCEPCNLDVQFRMNIGV